MTLVPAICVRSEVQALFTRRDCLRMRDAIKRTDVISKLYRVESKSNAESLLNPNKGSLRARPIVAHKSDVRERPSIGRERERGGRARRAALSLIDR